MKSSATNAPLSPFALALHVLGGLVLLFILAPLIGLLLQSSPTELSDAAADREIRESIWLTLWTAMAATLLMAVGAIPLGYLLARRAFPFKNLLLAIIDIPIVIPHSAAGIALLGVLSKNALIGGTLDRANLSFVSTTLGIIAAMAFVSVPFLVSAARIGFLAVPERLEQVALSLGASPARVFFTISMPLAWRSIVSGLVLMWGRGMSEFGAVMIIAYHPMVTPVLIWERFQAFGLRSARPLALIFIGVCIAVFMIAQLITRRKQDDRR